MFELFASVVKCTLDLELQGREGNLLRKHFLVGKNGVVVGAMVTVGRVDGLRNLILLKGSFRP